MLSASSPQQAARYPGRCLSSRPGHAAGGSPESLRDLVGEPVVLFPRNMPEIGTISRSREARQFNIVNDHGNEPLTALNGALHQCSVFLLHPPAGNRRPA